MNNRQLDALIKQGKDVRIAIDCGLTFRIARGKASWVIRYSLRGKRAQIALTHGYPKCSIASAKAQALEILKMVKEGIDPKTERAKKKQIVIHTVDELFHDWFEYSIKKRLKHPQIPSRIYTKEIKPELGNYAIQYVTPTDIRSLIEKIRS